jgi:hypothetical protein
VQADQPRRLGEAQGARETIDAMVGMILAENEDVAETVESEQVSIQERREQAWEAFEEHLLGLLGRGDISRKEYDDMRAYMYAERDFVRDARKKELQRRQKIRHSFRATLPAEPTRDLAYEVARGAALRADGEDRPVENLIGRKLRRERARQERRQKKLATRVR